MIQTIINKISDEIKKFIWMRKKLISDIFKIHIVSLIAMFASFPHRTVLIILEILSWNNWIITNIMTATFIVFWLWPRIWNLSKRNEPGENDIEFMGHSLKDILDHIFARGTFTRKEAEYLGISRDTHTHMVKVLDDLEIFVKGEYNARILNREITREKALELLSPASSSNEEIEEIENLEA